MHLNIDLTRPYIQLFDSFAQKWRFLGVGINPSQDWLISNSFDRSSLCRIKILVVLSGSACPPFRPTPLASLPSSARLAPATAADRREAWPATASEQPDPDATGRLLHHIPGSGAAKRLLDFLLMQKSDVNLVSASSAAASGRKEESREGARSNSTAERLFYAAH